MKKLLLTFSLSLLFVALGFVSPASADVFIDFTLVGTGTSDLALNGQSDVISPASDTITGNFGVSVGAGNLLTPQEGTVNNPAGDASTFSFSGSQGYFVGNVFTGAVFIEASGTNDRGVPSQNATFIVNLNGDTGTLEEDVGLGGSGMDTFNFSGPVTYSVEGDTSISVPEPNTIWLFALGLVGVFGYQRFRAKRVTFSFRK
jgi:hypothetical protein